MAKDLLYRQLCAAVPDYLVAKSTECDFVKDSAFLIEKAITSCARTTLQDIKNSAGGLLVKTLNNQQCSKLLRLQKIGNREIKVVTHTTLNTTKGIVVCRVLLNSQRNKLRLTLATKRYYMTEANGARGWTGALISIPYSNLQQNNPAKKDQSRRS